MKELHTIYHGETIPWLEPFLQTEPMKRLQQVGMNCGCEYTAFPLFTGLQPYSRYDHSVGAARIVWHFTGSKVQTAAALFHDIATPVFAHVIDFLQGDYVNQTATEEGTAERIQNCGELRRLLTAEGLPLEAVTDYHQYSIADNDAPGLAADRLEYTLGNLWNYGILPLEEVAALYRDLTVSENEQGRPELTFQTKESASRFAAAALKTSEIYVAAEDRFVMQLLADLLRQALCTDVLKWEDLWSTEPQVIQKLLAHRDTRQAWERFCSCNAVEVSEQRPEEGTWRCIPAKKRWIDPLVLGAGRTSCWDERFRQAAERFREKPLTQWIREQ